MWAVAIDNFMRPVIAPLGVDLVGVDYSGEAPEFLVDAHVLPFPDDSFDGVLSLAVLEHLRDPYRAVQEVARVLRPGGVFAGTVAFLEPFHLESLFHHSAYGTWSVLHEAGFVGIEIAPNHSWDVVRANIEMGLVGGAPIDGPGGSRRGVRWFVTVCLRGCAPVVATLPAGIGRHLREVHRGLSLRRRAPRLRRPHASP